MLMQMYTWNRFWCPLGGNITLDDGFLLDPEGEFGQIVNKQVVSTAKLPECPALILLGEAGSGKSHELRKMAGPDGQVLDLGEFGDENRLASACIEHLQASPASGSHVIFLDALDEALLGVPKAASVLISALRRRPRGPPRLILTCRTGAWPHSLATQLEEVLGKDSVRVFELLMLRNRDVREAAHAHRIDPDDFLRAVFDRAAEPLAASPVTLDLLLRLYKDPGLPAGKVTLYEQGLLKLCEQPEVRQERGSTPSSGPNSLSPAQLLSVATRVAALTTLSARPSVSTASLGEYPPGSVGLEELQGGLEGAGPDQIPLTAESIRAAMGHTGLFTARGPRCFGFAHKSYAEFLTARFIARAGFSPPQLRSILFGRDEQPRRVVPQLSETAAWLADLNVAFRDELLRDEPAILLRSDVRVQSRDIKRKLVDGLFDAVRARRVADLDDAVLPGNAQFGDALVVRRLLSHLNHPELGKQICPLIADSTQPESLRQAAIDLGRACPSPDTTAACADVALDPTAPLRLRVSASYAVIQSNHEPSARRLTPLALGQAGPDPDDQLKGCGLQATWPHHLSPSELLAALTPPQMSNYVGAYQSFLTHVQWEDALTPADLPAALRWARRHAESEMHLGCLGSVASAFAYAGWTHMNEPGVLAPLAELVADRVARHSLPFRVPKASRELGADSHKVQDLTALLRSDIARRRTLVAACLAILPDAKAVRGFAWGSPPLAQPEDFEWALEQACITQDPQSERYAELAYSLGCYHGTGPWWNPFHLELCLAARRRSSAVDRVMNWPLFTTLGSSEAEAQRAAWQQEKARRQRILDLSTPRKPTISRGAHIDALIQRCLKQDVGWFGRLSHDLGIDDNWKSDSHIDPTKTKGWALSDATVRQQLLECARRYLTECPVHPDPAATDRAIIQPDAAASATVLLWREQREVLRKLDPARWLLIAPAVVRGLSDRGSRSPKVVRALLLALLRRARSSVCRTILRITGKLKDESFLPEPLRVLGPRAPRRLRVRLLERCQGPWRASKIVVALLPWLIATRTSGATEYARSLIPPSLPANDEAKFLAKVGAFSLLPVITDDLWSVIWQSIQVDAAWGDELLQHIAPAWGEDHPARQLHERIGARALGELVDHLYERFSPRTDGGSPSATSTEDVYIRQWRGQLMGHLSAAGTDESVAALRALRDRHPKEEWLHRFVLQAEKQRRRVAWVPLEPAAISSMREDANRRVVRSGEELLDVLAESLRRWEGQVKAGDLVRTLWDEVESGIWKPKDEETLSGVLCAHLQVDLKEKGIVHGREVQLTRRTSKASEPGKRVDIWVETFLRGGNGTIGERLCAVIEVKGSWNTGADSSVKGQLVNRYLKDHGATNGLYVVGWFESKGWDKRDRRRLSGPWPTREDAESALSTLASDSTTASAGVKVVAVVLDCRLA